MATDDSQQAPFTADSALTNEEIEQRNLDVVAAHFHNENPDDVDKAIALYAPDICWEAPNRGVVCTDAQEVKDAYMGSSARWSSGKLRTCADSLLATSCSTT